MINGFSIIFRFAPVRKVWDFFSSVAEKKTFQIEKNHDVFFQRLYISLYSILVGG